MPSNKENAAPDGGTTTPGNRARQHNPPVELPSSSAQNFFEEASIGDAEDIELRRKFSKFCTRVPPKTEGGEDQSYLSFDNFCRLMQHYEAAPSTHFEAYFYAIDRNRDDKLDFKEFFLGCCAADPQTVHILNSFTGKERATFIFDFYDINRSGMLEFEEFERINRDCSPSHLDSQAQHKQAIEKANELGLLQDGTHFIPPVTKKFYEFIQNERLRGTSRLFRFNKTVIKQPRSSHSRRTQGTSINSSAGNSERERGGGTSAAATLERREAPAPAPAPAHVADDASTEEPASDLEDCEWHAHLLDLDAAFDPQHDEPVSQPKAACTQDWSSFPAYNALLPPAPAPALSVDMDAAATTDAARAIARQVLFSLCSTRFEGLAPQPTQGPDQSLDMPFTLVSPAQLRQLCNAAVRLLESEEMVITNLQPPVKVFGALHGQILDVLSHFKWQLPPVEDSSHGDIAYMNYVFLGNYADRGGYGLEVLTLLLSLKVANPCRVVLLRGHHESRHLNHHLGLRAECERRLGHTTGTEVYEHFNRVFEHLSLAAVIGNQMLALGPGILPPSLTRLDQLRRYKKPLALPHPLQPRPANAPDRLSEQVLLELFTPSDLLPSQLGSVREVGPEQVKAFTTQHRLATIVTSRQVPRKGFAFECGGRLITICSCLNYCDAPGGNNAVILCVTKEEKSPNLHVRPKVITAQVAKIYAVLGRQQALGLSPGPPAPRRWPTQLRAPTPGRISRSGDSDTATGQDSTRLVILEDHVVVADAQEALALFPAFGQGRYPGSVRERNPVQAQQQQPLIGRGVSAGSVSGTTGEAFYSGIAGNEDRSGRPCPRGSLGLRRGSPGANTGGSTPTGGGKAAGTPLFPEEGAGAATGGSNAKGAAAPAAPRAGTGAPPTSPQLHRTPSGSSSAAAPAAAAGGASSGRSGAGVAEVLTTGSSANRRMAASPSADGHRLSGSSQSAGSSATTTAASGNSGAPPSRSMASRQSTSGNGKSKEAGQARGPSRPPGGSGSTSAASPKQGAASPAGPAVSGPRTAGAGISGSRRGSGELSAAAAAAAVASSRGAGPTSAFQADDIGATGIRQGTDSQPLDPQALAQLLVDSPRLAASSLPQSPGQFLQGLRKGDHPLLAYLCRTWLEAGLGDKEWQQALQTFETQVSNQPKQLPKAGAVQDAGDLREVRWTLETFSIWLMSQGRLLRECSPLFRAFDFDGDEMVGVADFLQGIVAVAASRSQPSPGGAAGLLCALAHFRLLDLEREPLRDETDLRSRLDCVHAESQALMDGVPAMSQLLQKASDLETFRAAILPTLQTSQALRLNAI